MRTSTWAIAACTTAAIGACGTAIVLRLESSPDEQARLRRAHAVVEAAAEERRAPTRPDPAPTVTRPVEEAAYVYPQDELETASRRRARRPPPTETAADEPPAPRARVAMEAERSPAPASAPAPPERSRAARPLPPIPDDDDADLRRPRHRAEAPAATPSDVEPELRTPRERRPPSEEPPAEDDRGPRFQLTYYDFPAEKEGRRDAVLHDARCAPIAEVTQAFHDQVCVQGSGRLASGATVSFARRDCECASVCPRTGQHICFEKLDRDRFPHGRGAMGRAITPLYTVAVDASVIPLGTSVFIPELMGLPRADGSPHDGCFLAEDRGLRVVGRKVDVFTGDAATTATWGTRLAPSRGVHVFLRDPRCSGTAALK